MPTSAGSRLTAVALFAFMAPGLIQPSAATPDAPGRFTMMPTDGGFVRLDTQTGVTSLCGRRDSQWTCETLPDGQEALRNEMAALEAENRKLKEELRLMEETFGLAPPARGTPDQGAATPPPAGPRTPHAQVPTPKDVDLLFDYLEGMVRKFKERVERLEKMPSTPDEDDTAEAAPKGETPL